MKHIPNLSSSLLLPVAGVAMTLATSLVLALVFQLVTAAAAVFVSSMVVLQLINDYRPQPQSLALSLSAERQLSRYPLAA